eukprot:PhM_4_TR18767/c2_g2_i1/m.4342
MSTAAARTTTEGNSTASAATTSLPPIRSVWNLAEAEKICERLETLSSLLSPRAQERKQKQQQQQQQQLKCEEKEKEKQPAEVIKPQESDQIVTVKPIPPALQAPVSSVKNVVFSSSGRGSTLSPIEGGLVVTNLPNNNNKTNEATTTATSGTTPPSSTPPTPSVASPPLQQQAPKSTAPLPKVGSSSSMASNNNNNSPIRTTPSPTWKCSSCGVSNSTVRVQCVVCQKARVCTRCNCNFLQVKKCLVDGTLHMDAVRAYDTIVANASQPPSETTKGCNDSIGEFTWACPLCTLINKHPATVCNACGTEEGALVPRDSFTQSDLPRLLAAETKKEKEKQAQIFENRARILERLKIAELEEHLCKDDGNCMFRAVSHQLYLDEHYHPHLRAVVVEYLRAHRDDYVFYFDNETAFELYCLELETQNAWGDEITLRVLAEALGVTIHVITSNEDRWFLTYNPADEHRRETVPVFLTYHVPLHYNSLHIPALCRAKSFVDVKSIPTSPMNHPMSVVVPRPGPIPDIQNNNGTGNGVSNGDGIRDENDVPVLSSPPKKSPLSKIAAFVADTEQNAGTGDQPEEQKEQEPPSDGGAPPPKPATTTATPTPSSSSSLPILVQIHTQTPVYYLKVDASRGKLGTTKDRTAASFFYLYPDLPRRPKSEPSSPSTISHAPTTTNDGIEFIALQDAVSGQFVAQPRMTQKETSRSIPDALFVTTQKGASPATAAFSLVLDRSMGPGQAVVKFPLSEYYLHVSRDERLAVATKLKPHATTFVLQKVGQGAGSSLCIHCGCVLSASSSSAPMCKSKLGHKSVIASVAAVAVK